jgi:outer membrane immunogenic protein
MLRAIAFGAALIALGAAPALAADLPVKAPLVAPVPVATNWTGFYFGGSVGGLWDRIDGSFVNPPPATWSVSHTVLTAGALAGAQYQFSNNIVLGVEGNFIEVFRNGGGTDGCHPPASCFAGTALTGRIANDLWTAGGRLGYSLGNWMPYLNGGWASAKVDMLLTTPPGGVVAESTRTRHNGAYIGAGVDWKVWQSFVLGIEYRHYSFAGVSATPIVLATGAPNAADAWSLKPRADTVALRASWLFNWGGPVVARY